MMDRKRILRLLGNFLVLMLLLTMLSRTFSSMTVARVRTSSPGNMAIYHEVTAVGKVTAAGELAVTTEPGQRVSRIAVREGDRVSAGEVLFELDLGELKEQTDALERELAALNLQIRDAENERNETERERKKSLTRAKEDYETAITQGDQAVARAADDVGLKQWELETFQCERQAVEEMGGEASGETEEMYLEAVDEAKKAYEDAVAARDESVRKALRELEDAREKKPVESTVERGKLERRQKALELKKLRRLASVSGKVTSPADGVVSALKISAGEITADGAAILLADLSAGCEFVAQIESERAKYVDQHAEVTLTSEETPKKRLENLEVESVSPSDETSGMVDVTVRLPAGELDIGSGAEMTIRRKSGTYEVCVPIQALNEGAGECYVYVTEEQETILGTQLIARKISVEVEDRNESFAALAQGSLGASQEVITSASRAITEGSPVRLEES